MSSKTTYTVSVYCATHWATGTMRGTRVRSYQVVEDSTIFGGCRAIDKAIEMCKGTDLVDASPEINPNPALLGWPLGEVSA